MSFDAGAIVGTLQLDKGQWEASVAAVNQSFGNLEGMAKKLGLTLKTDLEKQLKDAENALTALRGSTEATPGAIKNLEAQIQKLNAQLHGTTEKAEAGGLSFGKLAAAVGLGNLAYTAANKAMSFVKDTLTDSIKAAFEAEDAQIALASAITSTGKQSYLSAEQFAVYASSLMEVTNQDDELIKSAQAVLIRLTKLDQEGINVATKGAIGLAYVMKMDLTQAAEVVAKAMEGNYLALNRAVPAIRAAKTEGEKHAALLKYLAESYNQATDAAQAGSGPLKALKIWWGELEEEIGGAIIKNEAVQKILKDVKDAVVDLITSGKLADWASDAMAVIGGLVHTLEYLGKAAQLVNIAASGAGGVFKDQLNKNAVAADAAVKAFSDTITHCTFTVQEGMDAAMAGGKAWDDFKARIQAANNENKRLDESFNGTIGKVKAAKENLDKLEPSLRVVRLATGFLAVAAEDLEKKDSTAKAAKAAEKALKDWAKNQLELFYLEYKIAQDEKTQDKKTTDEKIASYLTRAAALQSYEDKRAMVGKMGYDLELMNLKNEEDAAIKSCTTIKNGVLKTDDEMLAAIKAYYAAVLAEMTKHTSKSEQAIAKFFAKWGQTINGAVNAISKAFSLVDKATQNSINHQMAAIDKFYKKQNELLDAHTAAVAAALEKQAVAAQRALDKEQTAERRKLDADYEAEVANIKATIKNKAERDKALEEAQKNHDKKTQEMDDAQAAAKQALDDKIAADKAAADLAAANAKKALDDKMAMEKYKLELKAFENQQAMDIAGAIMGTAMAVMSALQTPPFPVGLVLAVLAAAMGAVEIGIIASQEPPASPLAAGALLSKPTFSSDGRWLAGEAGTEMVGNYSDIRRDMRDDIRAEMNRSGGSGSQPIAVHVSIGNEAIDPYLVKVMKKKSALIPNLINPRSIGAY